MFNINNFNSNSSINFSNVNENNLLKEKERNIENKKLELKNLEEEINNLEEELKIKRQKMLNFSKEHNNNKLNDLVKIYTTVGTDNGNKILKYDEAIKNNELFLKKQEKEIEKNNVKIKQNDEKIKELNKKLNEIIEKNKNK